VYARVKKQIDLHTPSISSVGPALSSHRVVVAVFKLNRHAHIMGTYLQHVYSNYNNNDMIAILHYFAVYTLHIYRD